MKDKLINTLKKNAKWIIMIIVIACFIAIIEDIFENEISKLDSNIYNYIAPLISDNATIILKFITNVGSAIPIIIICVLSLLIFKNKNYGKYISINLIIIFLLNNIMKNIFQRPRPTEFRIINETGYSFPSAHSMIGMAFYGFIIYLLYKKVENKYIKWTLCTILTIFILAIGISRVYLGVHYASDVIGGFCFSIAYLIPYINIVKKQIGVSDPSATFCRI